MTMFFRTALTGGGSDALDGIDGAQLAEGDAAIIVRSGGDIFFHYLNATSGAAENSPQVVAPDINAGNKRWELVTVTQQQEISDALTVDGLTVEQDAKVKGALTVLQSAIISGELDLESALTVAGFLQLNNDMEATGNIEAAGFTIDGEPVGQSTDTYWNSDGSGNIYYRSGNILGNPIALNKYEITSNWEIPSGYHGMSVGPLDINADIEIAANSVWEVT